MKMTDAETPTTTPTSTSTTTTVGNETVSEGSRYRFDGIAEELRFLSDLHRMKDRCSYNKGTVEDSDNKSKSKNKNSTTGRTRALRPHDIACFDDDDFLQSPHANDRDRYRRFRLFNKFARSVCKTGVIARKEIFEAWAMALYVHECFLSESNQNQSQNQNEMENETERDGCIPRTAVKRFADLACSHGILSWALLLLSSDEKNSDDRGKEINNGSRSLTAVCVDIDMPKSSETAAKIFFEDYPQFRDDGSGHACWDYVEGPAECIVPDPSSLLVGIHACGKLSDTIIDLAIRSNAPLALVPCCHSKKILTPSQKTDFAALVSNSHHAPIPSYTLADFMDAHRKQRLIDAGYHVDEVKIPVEFTPKNRILLATPSKPKNRLATATATATATASTATAAKAAGKCNTPRPPKSKKVRLPVLPFDIPIADTPSARTEIRSIAGKEAGRRRFAEANPPPSIGLSVLLPLENDNNEDNDDNNDNANANGDHDRSNGDRDEQPIISAEALQRAIDGEFGVPPGGRSITVKALHRTVQVHPVDGRRNHTYMVHYHNCLNDKPRARELHKILKEVTIPRCFPRVTVRGS